MAALKFPTKDGDIKKVPWFRRGGGVLSRRTQTKGERLRILTLCTFALQKNLLGFGNGSTTDRRTRNIKSTIKGKTTS